jgi:hypothetical protein
MRGKRSPERALAAYCRQMARQHHGTLPLHDLPSRACEATRDERDDVMVRQSAHAGHLPDHVWGLTSAEALAHSARSAVMNESLSAAAPGSGERFAQEH